MYVVFPNGVGKEVFYRRANDGEILKQDSFYVDTNPCGKVLAEDGISLRLPNQNEKLWKERSIRTVSRAQAKIALHMAGKLAQVEALMNNPATDMAAVIAYNDTLTFDRASPTLLAIQAALGWTDQEVDDLFVAAQAIQI